LEVSDTCGYPFISRFQSYSNGYQGYSNSSWGNYGGGGGGGGGYEGGYDKMGALGGGLKNINWDTEKLATFEKNFYREDKRVSERTDREIEEFRRLKEMRV
jgi:ATP-dependent RNA helicase DDX5/DBP2